MGFIEWRRDTVKMQGSTQSSTEGLQKQYDRSQ